MSRNLPSACRKADREQPSPTDYCVHGLHYWPGRAISYKHWPTGILNKKTGGTYDEWTIYRGGGRSRRARIIARFQRLIDSYSDEDLADATSARARVMQRLQRFIESQSDGANVEGVRERDVRRKEKERKRRRQRMSSDVTQAGCDDVTDAEQCSKQCKCSRADDRRVAVDQQVPTSCVASPTQVQTCVTVHNSRDGAPAETGTRSSATCNSSADARKVPRVPISSSEDSGFSEISVEPEITASDVNTGLSSETPQDVEMTSQPASDSTKTEKRPEWRRGDFPFENIVFSGGGMKGYSYIGAIKVRCDCVTSHTAHVSLHVLAEVLRKMLY